MVLHPDESKDVALQAGGICPPGRFGAVRFHLAGGSNRGIFGQATLATAPAASTLPALGQQERNAQR